MITIEIRGAFAVVGLAVARENVVLHFQLKREFAAARRRGRTTLRYSFPVTEQEPVAGPLVGRFYSRSLARAETGEKRHGYKAEGGDPVEAADITHGEPDCISVPVSCRADKPGGITSMTRLNRQYVPQACHSLPALAADAS